MYLELSLGRRQEGAIGVVHEVQLQVAAGLAVACSIQQLQGQDAAPKHPRTPLVVHILPRVAGQRGHYPHLASHRFTAAITLW